jgi:hypothetical protein
VVGYPNARALTLRGCVLLVAAGSCAKSSNAAHDAAEPMEVSAADRGFEPMEADAADTSAEVPSEAHDGSSSLQACARPACAAPVAHSSMDDGFDSCDPVELVIRRRAVKDCPNAPARASSGACQCADPNAYCIPSEFTNPVRFACATGCVSDSECGSGMICACTSLLGTCVPAVCASGASCGQGCDCIAVHRALLGGSPRDPPFSCQTAADECARNADCGPLEDCITFATGHFCRTDCFNPAKCSASEICVVSETELNPYCLPDCSTGVACPAGTKCRAVEKRNPSGNGGSTSQACVPG